MCRLQVTRFLAGLTLALALATPGFAQSSPDRQPRPSKKSASAKRVDKLIALDTIARAQQRAEDLRARLLDLQTKELDLQTRLDDLDFQLRPENIQRALAFVGSVRPMDELRDALRVKLENEKVRVNRQLELVASSRERLESALREAEAEAEMLRQR